MVLVQIFSQQAICYCERKCPIELINASPGEDFNKTQDSFSDIKFSTPNQLEQSLNALKNKLSAFFLVVICVLTFIFRGFLSVKLTLFMKYLKGLF